MEESEAIDCCPKCGGKQGYEGVLTMHYDMTGEWGKEWECSGSEHAIYASKSMKCVECKARIENGIAQGLNVK